MTYYNVRTCFVWLWSKGKNGDGEEIIDPKLVWHDPSRALRIQQIFEYHMGVPAHVISWEA